MERKGMEQNKKEKKTLFCSVCGEPATDIICDPCKAKIQGEQLDKRRRIEKEGRTDTGRR